MDKELKALLDSLYIQKRNMMALKVENPTYVLLVDVEQRDILENQIFRYYCAQYGEAWSKKVDKLARFNTSTVMHFPSLNVSLMLLDKPK